MVKFDRVEMSRSNVSMDPDNSITAEQITVAGKQSLEVKQEKLPTRPGAESVESREDVPAGDEKRCGVRDNEEEVIIEAEFETVLEEDVILVARETAIDEEEEEQEEDREESAPRENETSTFNEEAVQQSLKGIDEETEFDAGGIEVELGTFERLDTVEVNTEYNQENDPRTDTQDDPVGNNKTIDNEIGKSEKNSAGSLEKETRFRYDLKSTYTV